MFVILLALTFYVFFFFRLTIFFCPNDLHLIFYWITDLIWIRFEEHKIFMINSESHKILKISIEILVQVFCDNHLIGFGLYYIGLFDKQKNCVSVSVFSGWGGCNNLSPVEFFGLNKKRRLNKKAGNYFTRFFVNWCNWQNLFSYDYLIFFV